MSKIFNWPIIGHQKIVKFLQTVLLQNKPGHAYLFYGVANLGKSTLAKYFIASLVCQSSNGSLSDGHDISSCPCQKCINCQQIFQGIHPDLLIIKRLSGRREISIEQIRFLKGWFSLTPFSSTYKFVILKGAENLGREASNSFLKILEEPPKNSVIIIIAENLKPVLPTIISRCQLIKFNPVPLGEMLEYYRGAVNFKEIKNLVPYAFGRQGLLNKFLEEQNLFTQYKIQAKEFIKLFGADLKHKLEYVEKNMSEPAISVWLKIIRDLILTKINLSPVNKFLEPEIKKVISQYSKEEINDLLIELDLAKKYLKQNLNPKLVLENFFLKIK